MPVLGEMWSHQAARGAFPEEGVAAAVGTRELQEVPDPLEREARVGLPWETPALHPTHPPGPGGVPGLQGCPRSPPC